MMDLRISRPHLLAGPLTKNISVQLARRASSVPPCASSERKQRERLVIRFLVSRVVGRVPESPLRERRSDIATGFVA